MRIRNLLVLAGLLGVVSFSTPARADIIIATIPDLQDTSSVMWDTLATTDTLVVQGVVTGADTRSTGFGFYIQDPNFTNYAGVLVFTGGSDLFTSMPLARGDRVEVMARFTEFQNGTELISLTGNAFGTPPPVTKIGTAPVPGPKIIGTADISMKSVLGERNEGMFLRLNNPIRVVVAGGTRSGLGTNNFLGVDNTVGTPLDTIYVDMFTLANPEVGTPPTGTVITFLQGILDERNVSNPPGGTGYRLQIRDGSDIAIPTPPNLNDAYAIANDTIRVLFDRPMDPTTSQNPNNYSRATLKSINSAILVEPQVVHLVTTSDPQVPGELEEVTVFGVKSSLGVAMSGPQSQQFRAGVVKIKAIQEPPAGTKYMGAGGTDTTQYLNQVVTTRGIVTAFLSNLMWIQDPEGGKRSGFKVFAPSLTPNRGDDMTVVGVPIEFFDETEFSGTIFMRKNGTGPEPASIEFGTAPAPGTFGTTALAGGLAALNDSLSREDYEGVLVRVNNVTAATRDTLAGGEWRVQSNNGAPQDTVHIDDRGESNYVYRPQIGDKLNWIRGPIEISFGNSKLEPRDDADFSLPGVGGPGPLAGRLALRTSVPNPVSFANGGAQFGFTLPAKGQPRLALYDLRGRLVTTLVEGKTLEAGPHSVTWNGADAGGAKVGAGIYFVQLRLGNNVATGKVVVAE